MFKNKFVLGIIAVGIVASMAYMLGSSPSYEEKAYIDIENYKREILLMDNSPLENIGTGGMSFFDPDENWIYQAEFIKSKDKREFRLDMTDSTSITAPLAGYATLHMNGEVFNLLVFDEGANFTLPFRDNTNGSDTYPGGRYINIEKSELLGKKLTIDFNKSRNYYCAYDINYACPIPPFENTIAVAITAGEKDYVKPGA